MLTLEPWAASEAGEDNEGIDNEGIDDEGVSGVYSLTESTTPSNTRSRASSLPRPAPQVGREKDRGARRWSLPSLPFSFCEEEEEEEEAEEEEEEEEKEEVLPPPISTPRSLSRCCFNDKAGVGGALASFELFDPKDDVTAVCRGTGGVRGRGQSYPEKNRTLFLVSWLVS